nr:zinc finger, CCHC-type [Tanacetum cinerariifolium]
MRSSITRDHAGDHERLVTTFFSKAPVYNATRFKKTFRMARPLFNRIVNTIWHSFFAAVGLNNDINVLYQSLLFNDLKVRGAPKISFVANDVTYPLGYYLVDGIYPELAPLVKMITQLVEDEYNGILYKQKQDSARKDMERADVIFDENRFSSVPRLSLRIPNGTEDISGLVVLEEVTKEDDLKILNEAIKSQDVAFWKEAISDKIDSIIGNNTWVLADLPPGCKPLGCKWIYKRKLKVDETIEKFKARLVFRYTSNPGTQHWQAIQRVLKYLKKTIDYRLRYTDYPSVLKGYTNARWISNTENNSSTSGWVFVLGGAAGKKAEWLKNLLLEILLWSQPIAPISIRCDSAATLAKAYSQIYNGKSTHLGVRHTMIRELITNEVVSIEFVRSQQNLADYLTKALAKHLVLKTVEGM